MTAALTFDEALTRLGQTYGVRGCTAEDIAVMEARLFTRLPRRFAEFLRVAGKDGGRFLSGSDIGAQALIELQRGARLLLLDCAGPELTSGQLVFCGHGSYVFLFFHLHEGDDPAIHRYLEGDEGFTRVAASFSEWLVATVLEELP